MNLISINVEWSQFGPINFTQCSWLQTESLREIKVWLIRFPIKGSHTTLHNIQQMYCFNKRFIYTALTMRAPCPWCWWNMERGAQIVPITCKGMLSCTFWPFNGHLLFIKCACGWELAGPYVCFMSCLLQLGAALPWPQWLHALIHPTSCLIKHR